MVTRHLLIPTLVAVSLRLAAAAPIAAPSAPQWKACTGWVSRPPTAYAVNNRDGLLVFTATGAGTEIGRAHV